MILVLVGLGLLLALGLLWLAMFGDQRDALFSWLARLSANTWRGSRRQVDRAGAGARSSMRMTRSSARDTGRFFSRHRLVMLAMFLILTFPPLVVLHMQGLLDFSHFVGAEKSANPVVAQLLEGEKLVPPQSPPPDVFTTREIETIRPGLARANRKWDRLKPEFTQRLLAVFKVMREQYGYEMVLLEGYRSPERQNRLMASGSGVTQAGAYKSYHQFGLAADAAFFRNGKLHIVRDSDWIRRGYDLYGKIAQQYGLTWGGNWSFKDYGHVELRGSSYDDPSKH